MKKKKIQNSLNIETKKTINEKNNLIVIVTNPQICWVGGAKGQISKFTLKNVEFLLCNLLLPKGFFNCQQN